MLSGMATARPATAVEIRGASVARELEGRVIPAAQHPLYKPWLEQKRAGVPVAAIRRQMETAGLDPAALADPSLPVNEEKVDPKFNNVYLASLLQGQRGVEKFSWDQEVLSHVNTNNDAVCGTWTAIIEEAKREKKKLARIEVRSPFFASGRGRKFLRFADAAKHSGTHQVAEKILDRLRGHVIAAKPSLWAMPCTLWGKLFYNQRCVCSRG